MEHSSKNQKLSVLTRHLRAPRTLNLPCPLHLNKRLSPLRSGQQPPHPFFPPNVESRKTWMPTNTPPRLSLRERACHMALYSKVLSTSLMMISTRAAAASALSSDVTAAHGGILVNRGAPRQRRCGPKKSQVARPRSLGSRRQKRRRPGDLANPQGFP